MKLKAEIELPENASWQDIEDAKAKAEWRTIVTRKERMAKTDLTGKCGSCNYFDQEKGINGTAYGQCMFKNCLKERSTKACKTFYKEKENK